VAFRSVLGILSYSGEEVDDRSPMFTKLQQSSETLTRTNLTVYN